MRQLLSATIGGLIGASIIVFAIHVNWIPSAVTQENSSSSQGATATTVSLSSKFPRMSDPATISFAEAAEKATPVVVHIRAEESQEMAQRRRRERRYFSFEDFFNGGFSPFYRREGSGSGVIFSKDGYIITNYHVVKFADIMEITLSDGRVFPAQKVGAAPDADIAVLKIEADDLPTVSWANSDEAMVGDWVLAIGNPFDYLTSTVTAGIISAKGRDLEIAVDGGNQKFSNFIQTDAAVNPGNSGGALVNRKGELLGINSAIATPTGVYAGYSFAIPVETVRNIVEEILSEATKGEMGFEVTDVDKDIAKELDLSVEEGVLIINTEVGSAARYAGLRPFDVITAVNGTRIQSIEQLESVFSTSVVGDVLELTIMRDRNELKVPVRLKLKSE